MHCVFRACARSQCFFIEPHSRENFFNRGAYYGFPDEHMRFAFFSKAALEFMYRTGKRPDVIHTHDWQTALAPVMLYETYQHLGMGGCRVCHTLHNVRHQGIAGKDVLWFTGLGRPEYYYSPDRMGDDFNRNAINFTKGAIVYIQLHHHRLAAPCLGSAPHRMGLRPGAHSNVHQNKFGGVLDGLDYDMWNPETNGAIPSHYTARNFAAKTDNTGALREREWLRHDHRPLVAYVARLDAQKGVHLIHRAIFRSLHKGTL